MKKDYSEVIKNLDELSYEVTQNNKTEKPFTNEFDNHFKKGVYIDKVSKEVLFLSSDKFVTSCGWPAFSKPVDEAVYEVVDNSFNMKRVEVRSSEADSHLGHVFTDGIKEKGGLRYCINSCALEYIEYSELKRRGYEKYIKLLDGNE